MSYSTLYKVFKTKAVPHCEFQNGWGSAPPVWGWLCEKYLGGENWMISKGLWALGKNPTVPAHMRFALLLTFDYGIVTPPDFQEAARLSRMVYADLRAWSPQHVNHWEKIAAVFEALSVKKTPRLLGIGLGCTSVSDPWEDFTSRQPFNIFEALYADVSRETS